MSDFYKNYYGQLKGYRIKSFDGMIDDELGGRPFPRFTLTNGKNDIVIEVSKDEEGNGGGFLFITNAIEEIKDENILQ